MTLLLAAGGVVLFARVWRKLREKTAARCYLAFTSCPKYD